jgi:hypothetical protein
MMKRRVYLLALPLLSITACLDMSDQGAAGVTSSQESRSTLDPAAVPAVDGIRICESHGGFCVGAPTIAFQDSVIENTGGRFFQLQLGAGSVAFAFNAELNKCVALKDGTDLVQVRACSGVPSARWMPERGRDGTSCIFRNQVKVNGVSVYLSGQNNGSRFEAKPLEAGGWFQQFFNPGIECILLPI